MFVEFGICLSLMGECKVAMVESKVGGNSLPMALEVLTRCWVYEESGGS